MATLNSMNTQMHSHGDMIILDTGVVGALGGGGRQLPLQFPQLRAV